MKGESLLSLILSFDALLRLVAFWPLNTQLEIIHPES